MIWVGGWVGGWVELDKMETEIRKRKKGSNSLRHLDSVNLYDDGYRHMVAWHIM